MRLDDFRIVTADRRGNHHNVRAVNLLRPVTLENLGAHVHQALGDRRGFRIRAGNRIAEREQNFGDSAHSNPADADEVNALEIVKRHHHFCPCGLRAGPASPIATPSIKLTISCTACGFARRRALAAIDCSSAGCSNKPKISCVRRSAVSWGSGMSRAAPARSISWALRNWWLSVDAPKGMKMAARPAAATSAAVIAPARQTIKSAWANLSAMFPMKGRTSALISRRA